MSDKMTESIEVGATAPEMPSDRVADLVEYIVCGLVGDDDAVSLDVTDGPVGTLIEVSCAEEDAGRIIGRRGRTIKAIRTLARALGSRVGTSVEVEVLGYIARGRSNREIAEELFISENTVKNHVRNILEKLQLHSRTEAALYAVREQIIDLG